MQKITSNIATLFLCQFLHVTYRFEGTNMTYKDLQSELALSLKNAQMQHGQYFVKCTKCTIA